MSVGKIEVSEEIAAQDLKVLEKGFEEHTKNQNAPELIETPLSVLRRDDEGRLVAGQRAFKAQTFIPNFVTKNLLCGMIFQSTTNDMVS